MADNLVAEDCDALSSAEARELIDTQNALRTQFMAISTSATQIQAITNTLASIQALTPAEDGSDVGKYIRVGADSSFELVATNAPQLVPAFISLSGTDLVATVPTDSTTITITPRDLIATLSNLVGTTISLSSTGATLTYTV